ncbi:probable helicase senataxin [Drosophila rhopaloa]|uniref:FHA domain-containing protein n=1 Tax=Drosophila rhopaloa TaxID=1041015 RepID=A0ABM5J514_DRORH|nr:probable helicase senataxin [Drosophila rhopaloa]XP_044313914.1 probable helicase senataxin [Drosophila rhopaloa]
MSSGWYLQHVTTGSRHILHKGINVVGRHSRCNIVLAGTYQYVSREHAKLDVSDGGVVVQSMNALNGIFINEGKLGEKINRLAVAEGSTISLGVSGVPLKEISSIHAIFVLKKIVPTAEEVILSSDDDDTQPLPAVRSPSGNQPTEFNLKQQIPNFPLKKNTSQEEEVELPSSSGLHLPKITDVKQELVNKTTEDIRNIFGEADEAILDYVMEKSPYVYNMLNNKPAGSKTPNLKIHVGDHIVLDTDSDKGQNPEPQDNAIVIADEKKVDEEEEYDERYAMSQAVLKEMKAEMAFSDGEEDFLEFNGMESMAEGSPSSQVYEEIVIISDSDDNELYDKVADWSKLLSQKVVPDVIEMSQTYPLAEEDSSSESELEISAKHKITPEKGEQLKSQQKSCLKTPTKTCLEGKKAETKKSSFRRRRQTVDCADEVPDIIPKKADTNKSPIHKFLDKLTESDATKQTTSSEFKDLCKDAPKDKVETPKKPLRNRSKSCYMDRPVVLDEPLTKKGKNNVKENLRELRSKGPVKTSKKISEKTDNSREVLVVTLHAPEVPEKLEKPSKSDKKTEEKKTLVRSRRKTIHSRKELEEMTGENVESKPITPTKVSPSKQAQDIFPKLAETPLKKSPRLLNRSKSCVMDRPLTTETDDPMKKTKSNASGRVQNNNEARLTRGPSVIEAPSLPKHRGKMRGVSAEVNSKDKEMQSIIERQRLVDYQSAMKTKWMQKPKDQKKEDQKIKEQRRNALKKLSEKPKDNDNSSKSSKRKKPASVPTVHNSNRGEFLTKGVDGPPAKVAKMENAMPPPKKPIPKRRSTIETFSQQLQAADEAVLYPQPLCPRATERKEAERARNQRTCNRVTFAGMEQELKKIEDITKLQKKMRKVTFNDDVKIYLIEKISGASSPVKNRKESMKLFLSSYRERREWVLKGNKPINDIRQHSRTILRWANEWLKLGSVDAVANQDILLPIPDEFDSFRQYRETFVPLMKLELLTTIEMDYKINCKNIFSVGLKSVSSQDKCYRLVTRVNSRPVGRFVLYTLSSSSQLDETFASLVDYKCVGGNVFDLTFDILQQDISEEKINSVKQLIARPVVDSLRVELGALSAVHQLSRSPLCRRIMKPTQTVNDSLPKQSFTFKGFSRLNEHQESICIRTYQRIIDDFQPSLTMIQGPPGSGKSKVISELCLQTLYGSAAKTLDRKILICTHSNTAVDHIVAVLGGVLRVMNHDRFHLLRFGMHEKMSHYSRPYSLEEHFKKAKLQKMQRLSPENTEILKKQLVDMNAEIQQLRQKANLTGTYLQQQLHQKERQLQLINEQLNPPLTQREEFDISKICVDHANIICTTLSSCVKLANYVDFFDICIIDEATQCTEPWTLLPMRFGLTHLVLVGDTQQLPAVVLSKKAIDFGLSNSMFDRIQRSLQKQLDKPGGNQFVHTKLFKLSMQYRMHPEICRWPNKYFYEDQLVNAECTQRFTSPLIPYCVINLSYTQDDSGAQSKSISNDEEARFVGKLLAEMDKHMPSKRYSYGLISPYQNQCYALGQVIPSHMDLTPVTVDSYQGLEKDVIVISNARTRGCGFLSNYHRLNVALTRPRRCLVICGNFDDLKSVDMWRQLLDDARERKVYFDLKREHVDDLQSSLITKMMVKPIEII